MKINRWHYILVASILFFTVHVSAQVGTDNAVPVKDTFVRGQIQYKHEPVTSVQHNKPIELEVTIHNSLPEDKLYLHFREAGRLNYYNSPMGYDPLAKKFIGIISEKYHASRAMEYYIEIFPAGSTTIRIPAEPDSYFTVESRSSVNQIIRPILWGLLIVSPFIVLMMIRSIQKAHVKRTTIYQQKIRSRRRQLSRQREKHYKDYLKRLTGSGVAPPVPTARPAPARNGAVPSEPEPEPQPVVQESRSQEKTGPQKTVVPRDDERVSTGELKRELDVILNRQQQRRAKPAATPERPAPAARPKPRSRPPTRRDLDKTAPGLHRSSPSTRRTTDPSDARTVIINSDDVKKAQRPKPVAPASPSVKPSSKPRGTVKKITPPEKKDTKKSDTERNERDKLLDILGLDI